MREVISVHIGQAGVQIGSNCWELYCLEHGVQPDGMLSSSYQDESIKALFNETKLGKHVPRSVFVDLDPMTIDEVRRGKYHDLFKPSTLINESEDAANNFIFGYEKGKRLPIDISIDRIRSMVEQCSNIQGIILYHSISGGTGSGFGSLLYERLRIDYGKVKILGFTVFPSQNISNVTVEPYNSVLAISNLIEHSRCNFVLDNESLYNICCKFLEIERPTYSNINQIIAQVSSSLIASMRLDGALNINLHDLITNLVPYSDIHFPICSYAPLISCNNSLYEALSVKQITESVFDQRSMMTSYEMNQGRYISCSMLYRGNIIPRDVYESISLLNAKKLNKFVDYSKTRYKIGISSKLPASVPGSNNGMPQRALCMFANTTSVSSMFYQIIKKFRLLYSRKAFTHLFQTKDYWYNNNLDQAHDVIKKLHNDYYEIGEQSIDSYDEDD